MGGQTFKQAELRLPTVSDNLFRIFEAGIKRLNRNESEIGVKMLFEPEDSTLVRRQQKFEERIEAVLKELKLNQDALEDKLE